MARLLVTGGAGYIGSHAIVELLDAGHEVICLDNYCNSSPIALDRVATICGRPATAIEGDVRDRAALRAIFAQHAIDAVIHFAALKAVGESVNRPLAYYDTNVAGTVTLLQEMRDANIRRIVFSSSATVYGTPDRLPLREDAPIRTTNPYGATKAMIEQMLRDVVASDPRWSAIALRYFNPIGAHASGLIGEDSQDVPNNLFPYVCQVAAGRRERLSVFGDDWPTGDGTGVRDYLHVVDVAIGHLRAYEYSVGASGFHAFNLGTGRGTSVLELVRAFEAATGCQVPFSFAARRPGDIAACWADVTRAACELQWQATRSIADACADGWRWQCANPNGYVEAIRPRQAAT